MPEENFLLVSLREDKAKKLAQVISNDTSRKLLDHLAKKKDATETDIAKELGLPISTVHYNLQHLVEAKLVQADEFHYSKKGKEVNHYSLTNKYVIIAPKDTPETFIEKLRKILPVVGITLLATAAIKVYFMISGSALKAGETANLMFKSAPMPEALQATAENAADSAAAVGAEAAPRLMASAPEAVQQVGNAAAGQPNLALWFMFGAVFAIIVFVVVDILKDRKKK
jgi:DNA-binding transcriptional ArsR family regulator